MSDWLSQYSGVLWFATALSVAMLILAAVAVPVIVNRMSADYFLDSRDKTESIATTHPVLRITGLILKNLFGGFLFLAGIIMLATPGQGVLTLFVGLLLLDFKGKRGLEIRLIKIGPINQAVNWIRKKSGREPLRLPS